MLIDPHVQLPGDPYIGRTGVPFQYSGQHHFPLGGLQSLADGSAVLAKLSEATLQKQFPLQHIRFAQVPTVVALSQLFPSVL